jgi:hypothetical protein
LFTGQVIAADLDRLAALQQEDGGWIVDYLEISPAGSLDWRGDATVRAVDVLRRNAKGTAPSDAAQFARHSAGRSGLAAASASRTPSLSSGERSSRETRFNSCAFSIRKRAASRRATAVSCAIAGKMTLNWRRRSIAADSLGPARVGRVRDCGALAMSVSSWGLS